MKLALPLLALTVACDASPAGPCPGATTCRFTESQQVYVVPTVHQYDVLVVMDDSPSMATRQEALVARLAPQLEKFPGGLPELRLEVISSSVPAPGLAAFPGCAGADPRVCTPAAAGYLEGTRVCGAQSNFAGPFVDAFTCAARTGTTGCGWEQPLAAARAALEGDPQDGSRFLRAEAGLALIIVTDEDDCSAPAGATVFGAPPPSPDDPALAYRCHEAGLRCGGKRLSELPAGADLSDCAPAPDGGGLVPVDEYVRFFKSLKPHDGQFIAAVLAGPGDKYGVVDTAGVRTVRPACNHAGAPVLPAVRLRAFVQQLDTLGEFHALCDPGDDVTAVLNVIGPRFQVDWAPLCVDDAVDTDPARPGVQPQCAITELAPGGDPAGRPIPACDSGAVPCWRAVDSGSCTSIQIERADCRPPNGTELHVRCATQPAMW